MQTFEDALNTTLDRPRSNAHLLVLFVVSAMALAAHAGGMGVRMALGAAPTQIADSVVARDD